MSEESADAGKVLISRYPGANLRVERRAPPQEVGGASLLLDSWALGANNENVYVKVIPGTYIIITAQP